MAVPIWLKDVVAWMAMTFGKDVVIAAKDWLQHKWRGLFASRNILILGAKQSGKTSLLTFLQQGRPYEVVDGEIRTPNPTAVAAIIDKKFSLQQGNWLKLKTDVPGDSDLRATWAQALRDVKPHGIVYMIDGRGSDEDLRGRTLELREHVLRYYEESLQDLKTVHVFVNYADQWAASRLAERSRLRLVSEIVEAVLDGSEALQHLRTGVSSTQLSPHKKAWDETARAVHKFGADLQG